MSALRPKHALVLGLALFATGCHEFVVVNGRPAAPDPQLDERHSSVIGDVIVVEPPTHLDSLCPDGWAKIERRVTFTDGLVTALGAFVLGVSGVYKADHVAVTCAADSGTVAQRR